MILIFLISALFFLHVMRLNLLTYFVGLFLLLYSWPIVFLQFCIINFMHFYSKNFAAKSDCLPLVSNVFYLSLTPNCISLHAISIFNSPQKMQFFWAHRFLWTISYLDLQSWDSTGADKRHILSNTMHKPVLKTISSMQTCIQLMY